MVALNVDLAQRESSNKELADPGQPTLNLGLPGFFYFKYFIWLQQVLVAAHGLCCRTWTSLAVVLGLSSCPTEYGILRSKIRYLPSSPALEGRFLTTGLPGKSLF